MGKEGLSLQQFLDGMQTAPKKLTITQLREREEFWRALWSWTDDEVKKFILRVGSTIRIVRRDYKGTVGELGTVRFDIRDIEVLTYEKVYNYFDNKWYFETKVDRIPWSVIAWTEFISEQVAESETEEFQLEPLAEEVL